MNSKIFDKLSFLSLFLVIVLLPIFYLPFVNVPIETGKGLLLVTGLVACVIFWAIARFLDGRIIFPKSWLLLSGFGVVLSFLLSALFSGNPKVSLFGTMLDVGSFWFIFGSFILMLFSSIIFRTPKHAKIVLFGTILSSVLVLIFQGVHLFFPTVTSFGVLVGKTANIFGSWNALGLFAGFSVLMFLLVIEFFPISKIEKIFLEVFILLGILLATSVNFSLVWTLLGISSLIIFVYKVSTNFQGGSVENSDKKVFPLVSFIVVVVSLLFFMSAGSFGNIVPKYLDISNAEVGPSFRTTMSITKDVLIAHPVFGIGSNRFGEAWSMYKPVAINNTQFWDVSFNYGFGLLPTLFSTVGGLGILAGLVFFILFLIVGMKSVFSSIKNGSNWEMVAFFVLPLYLFISSFFYSTGAVIFLLSLAFTGIFVGLVASSSNGEVSISFLNDHRKSFFSILALIFVIIISISISFKYAERMISVLYFEKSLSAATIPIAETSINKALALYENDLYLRTYAQIYLLKLDSLAVKKATNLSEADTADLQSSLDQTVRGAQLATAYNPKNYLNFQTLGYVYQSLALFGVKDAYNKAIEAYKIASDLNPNNPGLKLSIANMFKAIGKIKDAKDYGNAALDLKPDYVDALIALSQIAKSEGNIADALSYGEKALSIYPANTDLIKYINSLKNEGKIPDPVPDLNKTTKTKKP
ncbi:MAG: tetratricopeptide repeat protein [Candidatus Paceibacterota bacterium]|jgi:tetratricopeptide (TPR) repeat protein